MLEVSIHNTVVLNHVQKTNYILKMYKLQFKEDYVRNHVNSSMIVITVLYNVLLEIFIKWKKIRKFVFQTVKINLLICITMFQVIVELMYMNVLQIVNNLMDTTNLHQVQLVSNNVLTILHQIEHNVLKIVVLKLVITSLINMNKRSVYLVTHVQNYFILIQLISQLYKYNVKVNVYQKHHILIHHQENVLLHVQLDNSVIIISVTNHVHHTVQTNILMKKQENVYVLTHVLNMNYSNKIYQQMVLYNIDVLVNHTNTSQEIIMNILYKHHVILTSLISKHLYLEYQ